MFVRTRRGWGLNGHSTPGPWLRRRTRANDDELHPLQEVPGVSNENMPQLKSNTGVISAVVAFLASYLNATTVFADGGLMHSSPGL